MPGPTPPPPSPVPAPQAPPPPSSANTPQAPVVPSAPPASKTMCNRRPDPPPSNQTLISRNRPIRLTTRTDQFSSTGHHHENPCGKQEAPSDSTSEGPSLIPTTKNVEHRMVSMLMPGGYNYAPTDLNNINAVQTDQPSAESSEPVDILSFLYHCPFHQATDCPLIKQTTRLPNQPNHDVNNQKVIQLGNMPQM